MRRARLKFEGAIHHAMNRGHDGLAIMPGDEDKRVFLEILDRAQKASKVKILAYCLMDNHYHLIIHDHGCRITDFFKRLNGMVGRAYRRRHGGRGYVFQDRYKSLLIQDDAYLKLCLAYVLNNPVKAKLCRHFSGYRWSSGREYFAKDQPSWLQAGFIEDLFGTESSLVSFVDARLDQNELPVVQTSMGLIIGDKGFVPVALDLANRRGQPQSTKRKRRDDFDFEPVEKVIREFEAKHGLTLEDIDPKLASGKRLRGELLVNLKDRSGLTYRELAEMDLFSSLRMSSLGVMYLREKARAQSNGPRSCQKVKHRP